MNKDRFKYSDCAMQRSMGALGTKWKPIVVWYLRDHKARFGQLAATIGSISRKVLTDTLKELEADGLIIREEYKELPPRVEYSLTEKGIALLPILKLIVDWDETFRPEDPPPNPA
jgi:DNA-binding HxlR family transcriptional regulator